MFPGRKYRLIALVGVLLIILTIGPTILATVSGPPEYSFGGFLLNPIDGASYLAKMYQGWRGDWMFTLPYTPDPGQGAYINMFYILLGHLARLFHSPLILIFHIARLGAIVALLFALYDFLEATLPEPQLVGPVFGLASLTSGMGWLAIPFGGFTSDFWVAEMYPFLSAYSTPHFALGLAVLLFIITPKSNPVSKSRSHLWPYALAAFFLAVISPFGVVVALMVLGIRLIRELWPLSSSQILHVLTSRVFWVFLTGGPILLYYLWVVRTNPALAGWNAQNITPSPPVWDLALSLSPFLWLAIPGVILIVKRKDIRTMTLVFWAVLGLVLIYLPFGLQRRFLIGIFVPIVALAVIGLAWLTRAFKPRLGLYTVILFWLTIPTNSIIILGGIQAVRAHDLRLYMTRAEVEAFQWIKSNTPAEALILAAPQTGLMIPAQTGRRVIYGHPFESIHAVTAEREVVHFYQTGDPSILVKYPVGYIFYGPNESKLNPEFPISALEPVYSSGGVTIYASQP